MPYVKPEIRKELLDREPDTEGELNYVLTETVLAWIKRRGGLNYAAIAQATGVLENVKQELYRRVAAPYEDRKIAENGDVYPEPWPDGWA